jgi:hypothetical protein
MRRRHLLTLVSCALPQAALAQRVQRLRARRIGFLIGNAPSLIAAFKDELARLGYVDGESLFIETRIARQTGAATTVGLRPPLIAAPSPVSSFGV